MKLDAAERISWDDMHWPAPAASTVPGRRILLVDSDPRIRQLIGDFLHSHGYALEIAGSGTAMRAAITEYRPDLIVLDPAMPDEDGFSLLRAFVGDAPPVIVLSSAATDIDRIIGLELGADDYIAKPCNPRELLARIRAVLRRLARGLTEPAPAADLLRFAGWILDIAGHLLTDPDGNVITLTSIEFRLLLSLAERPRRVLSRDRLLDLALGDAEIFNRTIDAHICRLRRKLARAGEDALIHTMRSEGYVFVPPVMRPSISINSIRGDRIQASSV
jgi:two-component system OmpR family response regulator